MRPKNDERKMEVYDFVTAFIRERGVCPTTLQIGEELGMAKSTVSKYMSRLKEDGLIEKYGRYQTTTADSFSCIRMPIVGEIACGEPIYADEEHESFAAADSSLDANFCLRARGDSMTGARIYDGDIVFIRSQDSVDNGEIAAVIINDEATLKRVYYYPEDEKLILSPENPRYAPLVYIKEELNSIKILGKAVAFQSTIV